MNHFTLGDWVDFVRQLKDSSTRAEMQQHLNEPCEQCSNVVRMWQDLFEFGSNERLYVLPDAALRSVSGYYNHLKPDRNLSGSLRMASLLFDSSTEPMPAGIRSAQTSARQLLYSAGNLLIDLRLEQKPGRVYLAGQAQPRTGDVRQTAEMAALVLHGTQLVAETKCNRFGEFQFELGVAEAGEGFSIILKSASSIVIALHDLQIFQGGDSQS